MVLLSKGAKISNYKVEGDIIGSPSSFGCIYPIVDNASKRYALKILQKLDNNSRLRFQQENDILYDLLENINVIDPISKVELIEDYPYYIMELADGDLHSFLLQNSRTLTDKDKCKLLLQIIEGTEYAHQKGYVHRDLKDINVLTITNAATVIKLCDFGIAKNFNSSIMLTSRDDFWGASLLHPPEVRFGLLDNDRLMYILGDLYSIGIIAFTLFNTRPTLYLKNLELDIENFKDLNGIDNINNVEKSSRKDIYKEWLRQNRQSFQGQLQITASSEELTTKLNNIIGRCIDLDFEDRFQTLKALEDELILAINL